MAKSSMTPCVIRVDLFFRAVATAAPAELRRQGVAS